MIDFQDLTERIRNDAPLPFGLAPLLHACTPFFTLGMWWRLRQEAISVDAHVISFGNITAGGAGKTPAVIARARQEMESGRKTAIITRGYGSAKTPEPYAQDAITTLAETAALMGDEPALMLRLLPGVVVVKAADRVAGARYALEHYGCETLILDDGYQHVRLARDENIVLIDASNPFGGGQLVPRGMLREPLEALNRATAIILTRCDQAQDLEALETRIRKYRPDLRPTRTQHTPTRLWALESGESFPLTWLQDRRIHACCAIAHPTGFFRTLEKLGAKLKSRQAYPDHRPIPARDLPDSLPVIVTEKDAVRMPAPGKNVYALGIEMQAY